MKIWKEYAKAGNDFANGIQRGGVDLGYVIEGFEDGFKVHRWLLNLIWI